MTCEINPLAPIWGLTGYVLSHLERLENAPDKIYLANRIKALPQELQDSISQHDTWPMADNCTLEPTRYADPESWMLGLASGKAIPWLEDLDQGICAAKHREKPDGGGEWDWELLVRRLAQTNVFERGQPMHSAPKGLRNRRRIWRCCVEMESDKVDHEKKTVEEFRAQFSKARKTVQDTLPSPSTVAQQAQQPAAHAHAPAASSSKSQK